MDWIRNHYILTLDVLDFCIITILFLSCGGTDNKLAYSSNGTTWTTISLNGTNGICLASVNNAYLTFSNSTSMTSSDGTSWTAQSYPFSYSYILNNLTSNTVSWLDTSIINQSNNSSVTTWTSKYGLSAYATSGREPTYLTNQLNGLGIIRLCYRKIEYN
jgi:hypothetical protein